MDNQYNDFNNQNNGEFQLKEKRKAPIGLIIIIIILVIALIGTGFYIYFSNSNKQTNTTVDNNKTNSDTTIDTDTYTAASFYKLENLLNNGILKELSAKTVRDTPFEGDAFINKDGQVVIYTHKKGTQVGYWYTEMIERTATEINGKVKKLYSLTDNSDWGLFALTEDGKLYYLIADGQWEWWLNEFKELSTTDKITAVYKNNVTGIEMYANTANDSLKLLVIENGTLRTDKDIKDSLTYINYLCNNAPYDMYCQTTIRITPDNYGLVAPDYTTKIGFEGKNITIKYIFTSATDYEYDQMYGLKSSKKDLYIVDTDNVLYKVSDYMIYNASTATDTVQVASIEKLAKIVKDVIYDEANQTAKIVYNDNSTDQLNKVFDFVKTIIK